jgi:hypothetical protein
MTKKQAEDINQVFRMNNLQIKTLQAKQDSLQKIYTDLDSFFFETGKAAVYYKFEAEKLQRENVRLAADKRKRTTIDIYMATVWTLVGAFGIHSIITR